MSRLSQRSSNKPKLSSAALEQLEIQRKKAELKELMKHNALAYRQAIDVPDTMAGTRSLKVTVPHEFKLSGGQGTPRGEGAPARRQPWEVSLRGAGPSQDKLKLTAPEVFDFKTARRSRSRSSSTQRSWTGCARQVRSLSANRREPRSVSVTRREQEEELALEQEVVRSSLQPPAGVEHDQWIREASSAQERAQRARTVAKVKMEQSQASERARFCIFKPSGGSAAAAVVVKPAHTDQELNDDSKGEGVEAVSTNHERHDNSKLDDVEERREGNVAPAPEAACELKHLASDEASADTVPLGVVGEDDFMKGDFDGDQAADRRPVMRRLGGS